MLYPRKVLEKIKKVIKRDEFILIAGARQAGKTSLLILLKQFIEEAGGECHYFNLENPEYLNALNKHPFNIFDFLPKKQSQQYVFIDEIQYLNDPSNFLKLLYDERRDKIKIVASGSSAFYIDKKFKDSMVGRKLLFEVFPLDFEEFLLFTGNNELIQMRNEKLSAYYKSKILALWETYTIYGGYPKVALADNNDMRVMMLEEIGSSYVKKDIADAGIKSAEKYFHLLKIIAQQRGGLVNSQELSSTLGIANKTVDEYLYTMGKSYQIAFVRPFFANLRKELTKMPKAYFYDCGLANFFLNNYSAVSGRDDKGACLENIVFRELVRDAKSPEDVRFWRTQDKKEVDFVCGSSAYEVKFSKAVRKANGYTQFQKQYPQIKLEFIGFDDVLKKFYGWNY